MRIPLLFLMMFASAAFGALSDWHNEIKNVLSIDIDIPEKLEELETVSWKKKKEQEVNLALVAIGLTSSGRQLLKKFSPLLKEERVKIIALRQSGGTAGYYESGKVYVDTNVPLIALAATLFHEATHAVDWNESLEGKRRWEQFQRATSMEESGPILLASEFLAYGAQNVFLEELSRAHQNIPDAVEYAVTFRYILAQPLSPQQFQALMTAPENRGGYGIPTAIVESFLKENRWPENPKN